MPLLILVYLTGPELGKYYLFTITASTIVFFISLEIAVPSSKKYLRAWHTDIKKNVFTSLLCTQFSQGLLFTFPIMLVFGSYLNLSPIMIILSTIYLITEACVNETGRFFWNIGEVFNASIRDFFRALFFAVSIGMGIFIDGAAIAVTALSLLSVFNMTIILWEQYKFGNQKNVRLVGFRGLLVSIRKTTMRAIRMVRAAVPQVAHLQILGIHPLLERWFIERSVGLEMVGLYSFQYSLVQAGFSLLLLPYIANLRKSIFEARVVASKKLAILNARNFAMRTMLIGLLCSFGAYFSLPILNLLLNKNFTSQISVMIAVWLSASASVYAAAVAPLYGSKERIIPSNFHTFLAMLPLVAGFLLSVVYGHISFFRVLVILSSASLLQLAIRYIYFSSNITIKVAR